MGNREPSGVAKEPRQFTAVALFMPKILQDVSNFCFYAGNSLTMRKHISHGMLILNQTTSL